MATTGENFYGTAALTWPYYAGNAANWPSSWGVSAGSYDKSITLKTYNYSGIPNGGKRYFNQFTWESSSSAAIPNLYLFANAYGPSGNDEGHYVADDSIKSEISRIYGPDKKIIYATFQQYYSSDGKKICALINGKLYNIMYEVSGEGDAYSFSDKKGLSSVEPYQPIDSSEFSVTVKKTHYTATSKELSEESESTPLYGLDAIRNKAELAGGSLKGCPSEGYATTPDDTLVITATFGSDSVKWTIGIDSWKNDVRSVVPNKTATEIPAYAGVALSDDFARCFSLQHTCSNDYKTITDTIQETLSLSNITIVTAGPGKSAKKYKEGDKIAFSYRFGDDATDYEATFAKAYVPVSNFGDSLVIDAFKRGDTVSLPSLTLGLNSQRIKFTNGKFVNHSDIDCNRSLTAKMGDAAYDSDESFIVDDVEEVKLTYSLSGDYFRTAKTDEINIPVTGNTEGYITSCKLSGAKSSIAIGEKLEFGDDAEVVFYDGSGNERSRKKLSEGGVVISYPEGYGEYPSSALMTDTVRELKFVVCPYGTRRMEVAWDFTVDYYETSLPVITSPAKTEYYFDIGDTPAFDASGMKVRMTTHKNSEGLGTLEKTDLDGTSLTFSGFSADGATAIRNKKTVTFSVIKSNQTLSGSVDVMLVRNGIESIEAYGSDSTAYWDNGEDKFHYPTGITLKYLNTDGTAEEQAVDDSLLFYRDSGLTQRLTSSSAISKSGGSAIYIVPSKTNAIGERISAAYQISFKKDSIISVFPSETVKPYLGNKLSRVKDSMVLIANRDSGIQTQIAQSDWYFSTTGVILSEGTLSVIVDGESFDIPSSSVEWQKPSALIQLDTSSFPISYMNKADSIDANKLSAKIIYDDGGGNVCDYSKEITYTKETSDVTDGRFSVSCSAIPDYVFDGSAEISLDLGGDGTKSLTLAIASYDAINEARVSAAVTVSIFEIYDITGISIRNAKTDYTVGETFLNDDDDTTVRIFYKDANGSIKVFETYLRDEMTALNIYPPKGTKFTTIQDSREISVTVATNYNVKATYQISIGARCSSNETTTHSLVACKFSWGDFNEEYFLVDSFATHIDSSGKRVLNGDVDMDELEVYGYLTDLNDPDTNARVVMFDDYIPPVEGSNNITVRYPCYEEGNSDIVDNSHFGILFGNNNARNRLFISGNPDKPNMDWRSGECDSDDLSDESMAGGNFAYFEDTSYATYGETDNAVVGYDIISNDKLLVLKGQSDKETTVYFRTPTTVTAINGSGTAVTDLDGNSLYAEEFALSKGNNTVAGVSPKGIINFNGDSLFISAQKQLMGLDLTGIVGDNQRYASSRSYYIDEDLRQEDLDGAFLWSDNEYLFLLLREKMFVTHFEMKSDSQYEWWPLDIKSVSSVIKIGDTIYFGTYDGDFRRFNGSMYYDVDKAFAGKGNAKVTEDDGKEKIIVSKDVIGSMEVGDDAPDYYLKVLSQKGVTDENSAIYYNWATARNDNGDDYDFLIDNSKDTLTLVCKTKGTDDKGRLTRMMGSLSENEAIYLMNLTQSSDPIDGSQTSPMRNCQGKAYYLRRIQEDVTDNALSGLTFQLVDSDGNVAKTSTLWRFMMCKRVNMARIENISKDDCSFELYMDGRCLDLVRYHNQTVVNAFVAEIREYRPVEAFMVTKPYTMSKLDYMKTIWSFTITNDTNIPSEMELCFVSNKDMSAGSKTIAKISKAAMGLDMGEFNFESIDFERNDVPRTYSRSRVISNVKFATFGIRNLNGTNCVLSSMSMTYTFPYHSYGD